MFDFIYCIIKVLDLKEGAGMNIQKFHEQNDGFTLIELLLAMSLLGIIILSVSVYFLQANTIASRNNESLVAVNLARANFERIKQHPFPEFEIPYNDATETSFTKNECMDAFPDEACEKRYETIINDDTYELKVTFSEANDVNLIPVTVTVAGPKTSSSVKGFLKNER